MKILLLLTFLVIVGCTSSSNYISARPESNYGFSINQGVTTETSALFRVVYPKDLELKVEVINQNGKKFKIEKIKTFEKIFSRFAVSHYKVTNLNTNDSYKLQIRSNEKNWKDDRNFKTLGEKSKYTKLLLVSCSSDAYNEVGNKIWPEALGKKPDVLFMIGDNIYGDTYSNIYLGSKRSADPQHLWNRYVDHAMVLKLYRTKNLVPTYVTWDDHDYGKNDGDKNYKYKKESKKLLNIFFARENTRNYKMGPGVSSVYSFRGNVYHFLDDRYFRDNKKTKNGYHFGEKQNKWFLSNVKKNKGLNWLISGDQFFGSYHPYDSFEGHHPKQFSIFKNKLRETKKKFVFISGDRHLVELMRIPKEEIGHETVEYTVSGVHTKMYPGSLKRDTNSRRFAGFDGINNYAIFNITNENDFTNVEFAAYSDIEQLIKNQQKIYR